MIALQLLAWTAFADEESAPLPAWGEFTENTAEEYDKIPNKLVWLSFSKEEYNSGKEDGKNNKLDQTYKDLIEKLKKEVQAEINEEWHWVYYDSDTYNDHSVEGLGCTNLPCVSVTSPTEADDGNEWVYTKPLSFANGDLKSAEAEIKKFVIDVKNGKAQEFEHTIDMGEDDDQGFEDDDDLDEDDQEEA